MSIERRLLLLLLVCAPLMWAAALWVSAGRAREEVNELFDTELIRLARQVQATLPAVPAVGGQAPGPGAVPPHGDSGQADLSDLAIAVWDRNGGLLLSDREGVQLPRRVQGAGFFVEPLSGQPWRVYYLQSFDGDWLVAAGQRLAERDELVEKLTWSQIAPWLLVLPILMGFILWAVRRSLAPLRQIAGQLENRRASDLAPLAHADTPAELRPLVVAMNDLFARVGEAFAHERRFTADAAHELRTPLAVLCAQWDVVLGATDARERAQAEARLSAGLARMDRLVTQMLALSRLESAGALPASGPVCWSSVVEQAISDCLPLAERRRIELACEWPDADADADTQALPLVGDEHLLTVLLRNLLDNAARYAPPDSLVTLRFFADRLEVDNAGAPLADAELMRLGERFHRRQDHSESGSGIGLSLVRRIAELHGLTVQFGARADGSGFLAVVRRADPP